MFQRNKGIDEGSLEKYRIVSYFIYFEQYNTSSLKNKRWKWNDFFIYWSRRVETRHFRFFPVEIVLWVLGTTQDSVKFGDKLPKELKMLYLRYLKCIRN